MLGQTGCDDLKGVQRMAVLRGVDLGVQNTETCLVKITANPCKQIGLVGGVNHHLQALTQG